MGNIAIIPARGGSKRIPKKNIKLFLGQPIIRYSIQAALSSGLFEEVMVSTDDEEIAEEAVRSGAVVPFMRSSANSDDFATTPDVLIEVISQYSSIGKYFSSGCCIYPTAPFVTPRKLLNSYDLLNDQKFDSVFTIVKFSYPIQRALDLENGKINMINEEYLSTRSQDLPECFHDSGQFCWFNIETFQKKRILFTDNTGAIVVSEMEVHDIDEPSDWTLAEFKYKFLMQAL
jgi:N-acylneuraminate cytidylyltransferase